MIRNRSVDHRVIQSITLVNYLNVVNRTPHNHVSFSKSIFLPLFFDQLLQKTHLGLLLQIGIISDLHVQSLENSLVQFRHIQTVLINHRHFVRSVLNESDQHVHQSLGQNRNRPVKSVSQMSHQIGLLSRIVLMNFHLISGELNQSTFVGISSAVVRSREDCYDLRELPVLPDVSFEPIELSLVGSN